MVLRNTVILHDQFFEQVTPGDTFVKILFDSYKLRLVKAHPCLLHAKSNSIPSGQIVSINLSERR